MFSKKSSECEKVLKESISCFFRVEGGELFDKVVSISQYDEPTGKLLFYQMVVAVKVLSH